MQNKYDLPSNLPKPEDDGGADHLNGLQIPRLELVSTNGQVANINQLFKNLSVLFIYPQAGSPLEPDTNQELWDSIPGARGCTPQSCGFRDHFSEFQSLGINVFGLSVQNPEVQTEFVERNRIPFPILSDSQYKLTDTLNLPTFSFEGRRLIKRMALIISEGQIKKVFYPVFPPDKNAENVLTWLGTEKFQ